MTLSWFVTLRTSSGTRKLRIDDLAKTPPGQRIDEIRTQVVRSTLGELHGQRVDPGYFVLAFFVTRTSVACIAPLDSSYVTLT